MLPLFADAVPLLQGRVHHRLQDNHGAQIHVSKLATSALSVGPRSPQRRLSDSLADFLQRAADRADIGDISEPDVAMPREILPLSRAALIMVALVAAGAAVAGGSSPGDRRVSNTFSLVTGAAPPQSRVVVPSNGTGIGPSRPVVSNPYQVPLLQNAGSIGALR